MNAVQSRRYEMLVRVRDFGDAHADLFQESSLAQQTFAAVAEVVQLNAHTVSKLSAAAAHRPPALLVIDGDQDDLTPMPGVQERARAAEQADRLANSQEKFQLLVQRDAGHEFTADAERASLDWLVKWLKP